MSKILNHRQLRLQRSLLAMFLITAVAVYGCTTNRTLGNGNPTDRPATRTAPTTGISSSGTESETTPPPPPPMTSSYSRPEIIELQPLPTVRSINVATSGNGSITTRRGIRKLSPDEAAMIMSDQQRIAQTSRVRVLGASSPGLSGQGYVSANLATGQFINPALATNPQMTLNSSISSEPTVAISSGAGTGSTAVGTTIVGGITANANDIALGRNFVDNPAAVFLPTQSRQVPTNLSPELGTGGNLTTGAGTSPVLGVTPTRTVTPIVISPPASQTATATGTARVMTNNVTANATAKTGTVRTGNLRVVTSPNGQVTVTNSNQ